MGEEKTQADKKPEPAPPATAMAKGPAPQQHDGTAREGTAKPPGAAAGPKQQAQNAGLLQQSVGNQQANRLLRAAREQAGTPALPVSHPSDKAEQEAETVARKVTEEAPAHPRDHAGPAPGDPKAVSGDPHQVAGDPGVVHRATAPPTTPHAAAPHTAAPAPPPPAPGQAPDPTSPAAILNHPGPGGSIPHPTLGILERKLNADLRHVVVHHDTKADLAARALQARALTRGSHIWLASDSSPTDLHLMAHEVAHVLQGHDHTVHRAPRGGSAPLATTDAEAAQEGEITADNTLLLKKLPLPPFKAKLTEKSLPVMLPKPGTKRDTRQLERWESNVRPGVTTAVTKFVKGEGKKGKSPDKGNPPLYYYKLRNTDRLVFGGIDDIVASVLRPPWDKTGKFARFDVDHKLEWQLGGSDTEPPDNLWLLDASANRSAGSLIKSNLATTKAGVLAKLEAALRAKDPKAKLPRNLKPSTKADPVRVTGVVKGDPAIGNPDINWTASQIEAGQQLTPLVPFTLDDYKKYDLKGSADELVILLGNSAIRHVQLAGPASEVVKDPKRDLFYKTPFKLERVEQHQGGGGILYGTAFPNSKKFKEVPKIPLPYTKRAGIEFGGTLSGATVRAALKGRKVDLTGASPVEFDDIDFAEGVGLVASGTLFPTLALFAGLDIDLVLEGDRIGLERTFVADELPIPKPFSATGALTVFAGLDPEGPALAVRGMLRVELEKVAQGQITASMTKDGFSLGGKLVFDKKLFDGDVSFTYDKASGDYRWMADGHLGLGKLPGIKSGSVNAHYENQVFSATGEAQLSVPGLESGTLDVKYGEQEGLTIGGAFQLAKNIPGIESGDVTATVSRKPPVDEWQLSAHGTAKPKIPGLDTTLTASYEDGVFTIEGAAAYSKGMLSGNLHVVVSNRPTAPQGAPGTAPGGKPGAAAPAGKQGPGSALSVSGGGEMTLRLAPWLQATAGVKLDPRGQVELDGEVKLPDAIELFPAKEIKKNIVTIGLDIPIVGIAVFGQRVGIFATIQGGLDAEAGVGPGQLRKLGLKVHYEPGKEENTSVTGGAELHVPAHAGLRLFVRGALGAGIPLVSAEAGLEIGGKLGLEGAFDASTQINWTPKQGLVLDARVGLSAEPKFTFDVNGYVKVEAGAFGLTATLYDKKWNLAAFEYGSGLRIGVHAPVHYEQGKPFTFSLDDVQFELPKVDPGQILKDLVKRIA